MEKVSQEKWTGHFCWATEVARLPVRMRMSGSEVTVYPQALALYEAGCTALSVSGQVFGHVF